MSRSKLKALRKSARNDYQFTGARAALLERFENPAKLVRAVFHPLELTITVPEFTSLCPITGQPDFASLVIKYHPVDWCVESKSLKLYLMSYRQHGAFHEQCVSTICRDLVDVLKPATLHIAATFGARGGIAFNPTISYHRPSKS
jgi:7-cyano-7-deazaguanine reductase